MTKLADSIRNVLQNNINKLVNLFLLGALVLSVSISVVAYSSSAKWKDKYYQEKDRVSFFQKQSNKYQKELKVYKDCLDKVNSGELLPSITIEDNAMYVVYDCQIGISK